ncbi:DNA primase [Streptomyces fungicidicus]|uniref:DNA primase n=1 Tax=Streptomyces fungicidicus TaxID=68203 RepID=UPI003638A8EC
MNRTGLGLAIGAGYLLGRTKKLKMAVAVGGLVAGKKLNLTPRMVTELVSRQLADNPQFKQLGDQLRGELRGVGTAASGALVERQLGSLADRLHGRTAEMRGRLNGDGPQDRAADEDLDAEPSDEDHEPDGGHEDDREEEPARERTPKKAAAKKAPAKKAPPAKKAAAKKAAPAKKTAAKKTAAARGARPRTPKGGGE